MKVIGLTGGIGTGKSTVSATLGELGATLLDADRVGHEAYLPGTPGWQQVVDAFGQEIVAPDGTVDRRKLGAIVFGDPKALERLNGILHPIMYRMMEERIAALRNDGVKIVVLEAAILIEAKWTPLVDEVWVTTAPESAVVDRITKRNNLTEEQVIARIRSQMSGEERAGHADVVIDTDCPLDEVRQKVQRLWSEIEQPKVKQRV